MSDDQQSRDAEVLPDDRERHAPAVANDVLPETLHLIPIPQRPFFPGQVQPVAINPREWAATLEAVGNAGHGLIGLAFVDPGQGDGSAPDDYPEIGCVVRLHSQRQ